MKSTVKWTYDRKSGFWSIEDKFSGYAYGTKPAFPRIKFCGQMMYLFPVMCEWTGKQLGWRSTVGKECVVEDVFPAFFTFKAIEKHLKNKH